MLSLTQKLQQQLRLLPQQIQYQKLLQLNNLALELRIKNELDINPLLEEVPEDELTLEQPKDDKEAIEVEESETEPIADDEYTFEDFLNDNPEATPAGYTFEPEEQIDIPAPDRPSLRDKLISQLQLLDLSDDLYRLGEEIIGSIDDVGYLKDSLENIVKDLELFEHIKIPMDKAKSLLREIQHFDPLGIASRSLQECLLIQVEEKEIDTKLKARVKMILEDGFEDFAQKRYESIIEKFQLTRDELKEALSVIQSLNPKPGEGETLSADLNQITPDLIVEKIDDRFIVYLNERYVTPLRISKEYEALMSRKRAKNKSEKEVKQFLKEKYDNAKWFIEAISQRKVTMLKVMNAIVDKQREFFEYGEKFLKPMIYKDIAEITNLDISTISRVVNGKYVQSSVGIHELKYFFSEGLATENGDEISNKNVKLKISEIIQNEDKNKPYTDDEIAEILNKEGIKIARRTVAKYREQLNLPIAKLRREL